MKPFSVFAVLISYFAHSKCILPLCSVQCPEDSKMVCSFEEKSRTYSMFPNECTMNANAKCFGVEFRPADLRFCIQDHIKHRRYIDSSEYGESCPVFCPGHYRPVCGGSKIRDYRYRTFINKCHLDMLTCRGNEDSGYIEVPLDYCDKHLMKNIYAEKVILSGIHASHDFRKR